MKKLFITKILHNFYFAFTFLFLFSALFNEQVTTSLDKFLDFSTYFNIILISSLLAIAICTLIMIVSLIYWRAFILIDSPLIFVSYLLTSFFSNFFSTSILLNYCQSKDYIISIKFERAIKEIECLKVLAPYKFAIIFFIATIIFANLDRILRIKSIKNYYSRFIVPRKQGLKQSWYKFWTEKI